MTEQVTKLKVKLGAAEIEYEGGKEFLKDEVMPTVSKMLEMVQERVELQSPAPSNNMVPNGIETPLISETVKISELSTNTIANLLNAKTGGDLAIAAAAKLIIIDKQETISRADILTEMKKATAFYKQTMGKNLSNSFKTLVKDDRIRLVAENTYSLSNKERQSLEQELAKAE